MASASFQYLPGQWEVASDLITITPVNDRVKAHSYPPGIASEIHQFRQLLDHLFPRPNAWLEETSAKAGDGEVTIHLVVDGQRTP